MRVISRPSKTLNFKDVDDISGVSVLISPCLYAYKFESSKYWRGPIIPELSANPHPAEGDEWQRNASKYAASPSSLFEHCGRSV